MPKPSIAWQRKVDSMVMTLTQKTFVSLASLLLGLGLLMVCSASMTARPTEFEQVYLGRQTLFLLIAIGCAVVAGLLPARFWINAAPWLFALTLLLLLITLIPGVGTSVNGARRWLRLGGWTLQPSELAKVVVPLVVCRVAVRCRENRDSSRRQIVLPLIPLILAALLILPAPDLGTTLFLGLSTAIALWVSGWPMRNFVIAILLTVPALGTLLVLKPYQLKRVEGFLSTWRDVDQAPYQIRQSLTTLGVGGVAGTGLGHGSQKLSFLPEANTDFVFAVVGEELGLVGTLGIIGLWCALYLAGLQLVRSIPKGSAAHAAAFTLLSQLVLQAAINIAVVTAMVPPKGISHPLISYGGSSLLVTLVCLGVIISLSRWQSEETAER